MEQAKEPMRRVGATMYPNLFRSKRAILLATTSYPALTTYLQPWRF